MAERLTADLCVIGAGAAGLTVAAGASQMGARVVLVEKARMGGDCLHHGCVPSKALLAAAHAAEAARGAGRFGLRIGGVGVDFAAVRAHVQGVIAEIAPNDSQARFEGMGVTVLRAPGRFVGPRLLEAGGVMVQARRFVIATGSRPVIPPLPGLEAVPYLTNETLFDLADLPRHLLILGGGPIGVEMAQAFRRLGSQVTLIEQDRLLAGADPELTDLLRLRLAGGGIDLREHIRPTEVYRGGRGIVLTLGSEDILGSHLLVAAGRRAALCDLGLDKAGVAFTDAGVVVDDRLRSTNRHIYAIGDAAAGAPHFTHAAAYHAGIVLKQALFRLPARADHGLIPAVIYTDPELAQVGLSEAAARDRFGARVATLRWSFADNDRARAERLPGGLIKAVVGPQGRILGAAILGPQAGELIQPWVLAVSRRLKIGHMAGIVAPYPTLGEVGKRAAGSYFTSRLFSESTQRLVRFLSRFG